MANLKDQPPAALVERAIAALSLPINTTWRGVLAAAAKRVRCGRIERYPHGNSRLLLEAMKEA